MASSIELMQEIVKEDIKLIGEVIAEDMIPLIKFREQLEKKEFEKALRELKRLEEGL